MNIADEELNAGEAANFIISQMKAFNITADDAIHIIDAVNNVSNNTATSSADLAQNIGKASAALAAGNNTYEDTLALMTGIVEITRSGAKASRGLISIQSRYNQIVDESSSTGQKLLKWYKEHNIAIKDQEGQQRKLYDVLADTSKIWNSLSKDEQLYYLNIQAGANQTQNLAAALQNFDQVLKAHDLALNSSGSALDENARAMENLNKKIDAIKASWAELVLAFADSEAIGELLDKINTGLRALAENDKLIDTITRVAKAFLILKGLQVGANIFGGLITSGKKWIMVGKSVISTTGSIIKVLKDLGTYIALIKEFGLAATISTFLPKLAAVGTTLATIAPYVGVFLALGAAVGSLTGAFAKLKNSYIAKTSDDLDKVANAYLNLIEAKKAYEGEQGTRYKSVTGQDALDVQIEKLRALPNLYEQGRISAVQFLDKIGDIKPLESYYNALQAIIDANGGLSEEQQKNYNNLQPIISAYNKVQSTLESNRQALKNVQTEVGNLNGVYTSAQSIYKVYANSLTQVGGAYYFTSNAAKESAIATQKAIIAEAESVIENTKNEIAARQELAKVMSASSPSTSKLMDRVVGSTFGSSKLKSVDNLAGDLADKTTQKWENVIKTSQKAIQEINKIQVRTTTDVGGGGAGGSGKDASAENKQKAQALLDQYKEQLATYQKAQEAAYKKREITAAEYYSSVQKKGYSYYKKLKSMGKDYADSAQSMLENYKSTNTTAVKDIFTEIEYRYKQGQISGQQYYDQLWKYAQKFYKNGKIDFDSYRDYVSKGYEAMFNNIKSQYEAGRISAEEFQKKVIEAQARANESIRKAGKSGILTQSEIRETRNALVKAGIEATNEVAKALKQAAIDAAQAAVDAAEKALKEAQARQTKANAFIDAIQFWANEQTEQIDKAIDGYNDEIDKLREQMDLLDKQNEALDEQAERLRLVNALEESKKQKTVRVYTAEMGWIWTADPKKVQDAQKALDDFDTEQKRKKEKQAIQDQINALEKLIKEKEKEKQAYQDVINEQTKALERYNIEAQLGMTIEQAIFEGRTQNFNNWKNSYIAGTQEVIAAIEAVNAAQAALDSANARLDYANNIKVPEIKYGESQTLGAGYQYSDDMSSQEKRNAAVRANIEMRRNQGYQVREWYDDKGNLHYEASSTPTSKKNVKSGDATKLVKRYSSGKRATGDVSIAKSGLYNVNELGDELIVPPKGNFDYLKKGTGVVPANLTKNLMDWGKYNPKNLLGAQKPNMTDDHSITIQNLTVQSNDAKDFVRQLQNIAIVRG